MRRRRPNHDLPDAAWVTARQRLRQWPLLDAGERARLGDLAAHLLTKRWEASRGFALDDEIRATVALNAGVLYLGVDGEPFSNVAAIVIHPTTIVMQGERPGPSPGVVTDAPLPAQGHTSAQGPVFIAWDAVERDLTAPATNVVLHEFAHKLDALSGVMDGTPRLHDKEQLREWVEICTGELHALRRGHASSVLRPYAATNPSEFFAVTTESFFEQPSALLTEKPELYGVLRRFYGQDTAARDAAAQPLATRRAPTVTWKYGEP